MKCLYALIVYSFLFLVAGCSRKMAPTPTASASPFVITNMVLEGGASQWVVQYTNGVTWIIDKDSLTLFLGINDSVAVYPDAQTHKAKKIILETSASTNGPGQWIIDYNADGFPDSRRIKGSKEAIEVFYSGQWYHSEGVGHSNRAITINGQTVKVRFDGKSWIPAPKDE